jgi:hypothetical protein
MELSPVALSFRARFDVEQVFHNSFLKHAWGQQEIPYWFPLQSDAEFNITLQSDNQGFKVLTRPVMKGYFGNRGLLGNFTLLLISLLHSI